MTRRLSIPVLVTLALAAAGALLGGCVAYVDPYPSVYVPRPPVLVPAAVVVAPRPWGWHGHGWRHHQHGGWRGRGHYR
jgi:hypothetical protein